MTSELQFWPFALTFYKISLPYCICKCFPFAINVISFYMISFYKDEYLTAGFGLAISFYNLVNCMLTNVNSDTTGILLAKFYGSKRCFRSLKFGAKWKCNV